MGEREKCMCYSHLCVGSDAKMSHFYNFKFQLQKFVAIVGKKCLLKYNGIRCGSVS